MSEFSDFTKLVLDRMDTNPHEFETNNRWDTLVRALEGIAAGDKENRYARTLWAMPEEEVNVLLDKYRKVYLARLHKEMLKNIISGDDLHRTQYAYDSGHANDINPLKPMTGSPLRGNSVLTTSAMKSTTLGMVNQAFDDAYTTTTFANAVVKAEGSPMTLVDSNSAPKVSKYVLNRTQVELAQSLNMTPWEFAKYQEAVAKRVNGGTE